jgi:hypothetical protein
MKVLTATSETQGWRDNDFCWTVENELVLFVPIECGRGSIDDRCGCRRSMGGLMSHLATTTVKVADIESLDPETYFRLIAESLNDQGYVSNELMEVPDVSDWLHDLTDELMLIAEVFPVGTVLERRGDSLGVRQSLGQRAG